MKVIAYHAKFKAAPIPIAPSAFYELEAAASLPL